MSDDFMNLEWDLSGSFYHDHNSRKTTGATGDKNKDVDLKHLLELVDRTVHLPSGKNHQKLEMHIPV